MSKTQSQRKPPQQKKAKPKAAAPRTAPRKTLFVFCEVVVGCSGRRLQREARSVTFYDAQHRRIASAKLQNRVRVNEPDQAK